MLFLCYANSETENIHIIKYNSSLRCVVASIDGWGDDMAFGWGNDLKWFKSLWIPEQVAVYEYDFLLTGNFIPSPDVGVLNRLEHQNIKPYLSSGANEKLCLFVKILKQTGERRGSVAEGMKEDGGYNCYPEWVIIKYN